MVNALQLRMIRQQPARHRQREDALYESLGMRNPNIQGIAGTSFRSHGQEAIHRRSALANMFSELMG